MDTVTIPFTLRELGHELRIPLTGILGSIELIADELTNAKQEIHINDMRQASYRLLETINQLLMQAKKI